MYTSLYTHMSNCSTTVYDEAVQFTNIKVGSKQWFEWLKDNKSFSFQSVHGRMTVRNRTGDYWYAYKKVNRKQRQEYIGKTEELSKERLQEVCDLICQNNFEYWNRKYPRPSKPLQTELGQSIQQTEKSSVISNEERPTPRFLEEYEQLKLQLEDMCQKLTECQKENAELRSLNKMIDLKGIQVYKLRGEEVVHLSALAEAGYRVQRSIQVNA